MMKKIILDRRFVLFGMTASMVGCTRSTPTAQAQNPDLTGLPPIDVADWGNLTEAQWRARLTPQAFHVLRKEGTERPFTSELNKEKRSGVYHCAGCDLPLFASEHKYDSGTGWPSFWQPIEGALGTKADNTLFTQRTEYHCVRCDGHQGHVFSDGPPPTGLRYCNNGVALRFIAT